MPQIDRDEACEERIAMEAIVDAYGPEEQAMGWYYYLDDKIHGPFRAKCSAKRAVSPLREGETVSVLGMAPEEECGQEMFVTIQWQKRKLAVPLAQLEPVDADEETQEAVEDWLYWVRRGYEF